ncbi:MAG TPA: isoprenylcysteine carboxylmethyltransferase family protein [Dehalococcoidia bacterium]|nr:isoprenylcysteine carboxylmethyltransferase family protein [Dehalococcoidia bacterium]
MADKSQDGPDILPVPPPLIYVVPLVVGLGLRKWLSGIPLAQPLRRIIGVLFVAGGGALIAWFARSMQQAQTPINPTKPVKTLVTGGPFAFSRNPGYLGMATIYAGLALVLNSLSALLALPVALLVMSRGVIEPEERYLDKRFGEGYRSYRTRVRRWL